MVGPSWYLISLHVLGPTLFPSPVLTLPFSSSHACVLGVGRVALSCFFILVRPKPTHGEDREANMKGPGAALTFLYFFMRPVTHHSLEERNSVGTAMIEKRRKKNTRRPIPPLLMTSYI